MVSIDELITGVFGLLGALIGLGGALAVSHRTARAAREQARYTRLHERRDEVLATLYSQLMQLHGKFQGMVYLDADNPLNLQEKEKCTMLVRDALLKVDHYRSEHLLWLRQDLVEIFEQAYLAYFNRWNELWELHKKEPSSRSFQGHAYKVAEENAKEWLEKESGEYLGQVNMAFRQQLGVEPWDQQTTNYPWWRKMFGG